MMLPFLFFARSVFVIRNATDEMCGPRKKFFPLVRAAANWFCLQQTTSSEKKKERIRSVFGFMSVTTREVGDATIEVKKTEDAECVEIRVEWYVSSSDPACAWRDQVFVTYKCRLATTTPRTLLKLVPEEARTRTCTVWRDCKRRGSASGSVVDLATAQANRPLSVYACDSDVGTLLPVSIESDD
jgi:hypothetical protein